LLEYLTAHLHDREPVAVVAKRMGLSERTLRRRFHDQIGSTPGQWIYTERLRHAQRLLETTDLPVETIAHSVGLASATALRRQFRRELGITPTEHRRIHSTPT
jgi:AraC family transcriptional activator FtrA